MKASAANWVIGIVCTLGVFLGVGCSGPERDGATAEGTLQRFEFARVVMGSRARIVVYAREEPIEAVGRAFDVIVAYDDALSDYRARSEARRVAEREPGAWHDASPMLIDAIERSRRAWEASGGVFDVTIGAVTSLWREAGTAGRTPSDAELAHARACVGMALVEVDAVRGRMRFARAGMRLDFGGIGKGLAADRALASLGTDGLSRALVEIGGDVVAGDPPPGRGGWVVRLAGGDRAVGSRSLARAAVATSGDAYRWTEVQGERRSHVVDPGLAMPVPAGDAVSVVAAGGWVADAVATIVRLRGVAAGAEAGERLGGVEIVHGP